MKPLVSGKEAKRYVEPSINTYLLFPYIIASGQATLISTAQMAADYPLAWTYLRSWEDELRSRENGAFDDNDWYRFGRHQNLDKQEIKKLIVAQTAPSLRLFNDSSAQLYLNNVRVNGIVPARDVSAWYLLGVMNGKVCNYVFRRIAKPKDGGWFEANKQFVAPLRSPKAMSKLCKQWRNEQNAYKHSIPGGTTYSKALTVAVPYCACGTARNRGCSPSFKVLKT